MASLREELGEAVSTEGFVIPGGEPLARQDLVAVVAGEALSVVGIIAVGDAPGGDDLQRQVVRWRLVSSGPHLVTGDTLGGKFVLIAGGAVNVILLRDE